MKMTRIHITRVTHMLSDGYGIFSVFLQINVSNKVVVNYDFLFVFVMLSVHFR